MLGYYAESNHENYILQLISEKLGYNYIYGPDIKHDCRNPLYEDMLLICLSRINRDLPIEAVQDAIYKLHNFESGSLIQKNMVFMDYLQNGISVKYFEDKAERSDIVYLIDYKNPNNNDFTVCNHWLYSENSDKRPSIIIFINGLPLVIIEVNSLSREEREISDAYYQIREYMEKDPSVFIYNAICIISDQTKSKVGVITSSEDRFMEWKTVSGRYEETKFTSPATLFEGMLEKERFLDIIKHFICFSADTECVSKILAGYHQYFAVKKALSFAKKASETDGRGGVFWHTQGSGKSLSMIFYTRYLQELIESPTIVVLTYRNDLDDQLYSQFSKCKRFLRQNPQQAETREHLKKLLENRQANGIVFTTIQKFVKIDEPLSERKNIIVIADEAHRSQYGLDETFNKRTGKIKIGIARIIRGNLPNATYVGFTGTPISLKDRSTREIFGDYIDVYDMTQAVRDGTTRPVYYETRINNLGLKNDEISLINKEYDAISKDYDIEVNEKKGKKFSQVESILGSENKIDSLVHDIIQHYENYRMNILTGKAMVVVYSRSVAMRIYLKFLKLRPNWKNMVEVVMTQGNGDSEEWQKIIGNKSHRDRLALKFKDNNSSFKIAIVVDMWLTGFDVPSLATMYVYKPMNGYNLMQAIARVNRVFMDKEGGLIVDYIGISSALKQAMDDYTQRDRDNYGDSNIESTIYPKFLEKISICRNMLGGFNYAGFVAASDSEKSEIIRKAIDYIIKGNDNNLELSNKVRIQSIFIKEVLFLYQSLSLCSSLVRKEVRLEVAFLNAVRSVLVYVISDDMGMEKLSLIKINNRISEILERAFCTKIKINLFPNVDQSLSPFDFKFLKQISDIDEKNLSAEILKKFILGHISGYRRTNIVRFETFSEMMNKIVNSYTLGNLTPENLIRELLNLAKSISDTNIEGEKLGLSSQELAFYDAVTKPKLVKDCYKYGELIAMSKGIADLFFKNRTVDWEKKESTRARMRKLIKRFLKKYDYPSEVINGVLSSLIIQCEMWTDVLK